MRVCRIATDPGRPDPKDVIIQNHLKEGEWKVALRLVEMQGRKDKSAKVFINKCLIQIVWFDDIFEKMAALKRFEKFLLVDEPPVIRAHLLGSINYTFPEECERLRPQLMYSMWERACNAKPKDMLVLDGWYKFTSIRLDFEAARKVALRGFKASEDKHLWRWRAIVSCFLDGCYGLNLVSAKVSHGLSVALVKSSLEAISVVDINKSKAAKQAGRVFVNTSSPSIQTLDDLRTLLLIYDSNKMDRESLAVLNSKMAGLQTGVGQGVWRLALEKLKYLQGPENARECWDYCYQLLCEAGDIPLGTVETLPYNYGSSGDDRKVWLAAAESVVALKDPKILAQFQTLLDGSQFQKRNRLLTTIHLSSLIDASKDVFPDPRETLATAIYNYLSECIGIPTAYDDLRNIAERMSEEERRIIVEQVEKVSEEPDERPHHDNEVNFRNWMHKELNDLKLTYTFKTSTQSNDYDLEVFAGLSLNLYMISLDTERKLAITERRTGDDAAILAACAFIHLAKVNGSSWKLRAILILETLLEHSPHNYGAMLMLIRLYVTYGCWHLAAGHFIKLDLKNIQLHSEAWALTTRVAGVFPYWHQKPNRDMASILIRCAKHAQASRNQAHQVVERYEAERNHIGLCDTYEFLQTCNTSLSRATTLAELSRYNYRNRVGDCFNEETILGSMSTIESITRGGGYTNVWSFHGFPNFEAIGNPFLVELLATGPMPCQNWVEVEDSLFRWRRWTQKKQWMQLDVGGYLHAAEECSKTFFKLGKSLADPKLMPELTHEERLVALIITIMTAVQSSSLAIRCMLANLRNATVAEKDEWVRQEYPKYERYFPAFDQAMMCFMVYVAEYSKSFHEAPIGIFRERPWNVLHTYYKLTEIFMFIPGFILDRINFASWFRLALSGTTVDLDDKNTKKMLDKTIWEGWLREWFKEANVAIKKWNTAARTAQTYCRDAGCIKDLVTHVQGRDDSVLAGTLRKALGELFSEQWTTRMAGKIAQGMEEAISGIVLEDERHWRTKRWPRTMERYMESLSAGD